MSRRRDALFASSASVSTESSDASASDKRSTIRVRRAPFILDILKRSDTRRPSASLFLSGASELARPGLALRLAWREAREVGHCHARESWESNCQQSDHGARGHPYGARFRARHGVALACCMLLPDVSSFRCVLMRATSQRTGHHS